VLGYPTSDEVTDGNARYNTFQHGFVVWTPNGGAHVVQGAIADRYKALKGVDSTLGVPTTDELTTPDRIGRYTHFTGGSIYWSPAGGAHAVQGEVRDLWARSGWELGLLGYPTGDEQTATDKVTRTQRFGNGVVYVSKVTGTHFVAGAINAAYQAQGGSASRLGLPTSDETAVPGGRRSTFQHGSITWNSGNGKVTVSVG
jgi:uncharacterized protein with LGFP repeats